MEPTTVPVKRSWVPTRKWFAGLLTGLAALGASAIESGEFGGTEQAGVKALLVAFAIAYLKSNSNDPGGIPPAKAGGE